MHVAFQENKKNIQWANKKWKDICHDFQLHAEKTA